MLPATPVIRSLWMFLFLVNASSVAGVDERNVWIFLRDKVDKEGKIVEWRTGSQGHSISQLDLPVRDDYIEEVRQTGAVGLILLAIVLIKKIKDLFFGLDLMLMINQ